MYVEKYETINKKKQLTLWDLKYCNLQVLGFNFSVAVYIGHQLLVCNGSG